MKDAKLMSSEYRDRLKHWIRTLQQDLYCEAASIAFEGFITSDHLTPAQAARSDAWQPIPEGMRWGHLWEYMWLRTRLVVPAEAAGKKLVMNLNPSGESTLFVNGRAFGTRRAEWVTVPHHYYVDQVLTESATPGEAYDLLVETYCGHYYPEAPSGGVATGPVLPGSFEDPAVDGQCAAVGHSSFGVFNEDAYQLLMDVRTLYSLLGMLSPNALRADRVAAALEKFTLAVDFEQDAQGRVKDYRAARELLRPALAAVNGTSMPHLYAVGNSHLDLAWLWPMQETRRKTARTFAQQLRLLEMYPDYVYLQSQPASYQMCKEDYPELYDRIKAAVKQGRWIVEGAMYVEPDTNMTSGESLIRQVIYGKRFFKEEFGVDSRMLWLPDTFGYTAALPQILRKCGVESLVTQKIFWSYNDSDQFPYHYFTWRGMDGSAVTSFLPTSYTYDTTPEELCGVWEKRVQKRGLDSFLIPFGYGDGGGGPCRDHIEFALRQKDLEGAPRVEMCSPLKLFDDLAAEGGPQNTWDGELYFTAHRGTFTSQADIKRNNRRSEGALHEAEAWLTAAVLRTDAAWPMADLQRLWQVLLLHQFHDILPGSSIRRVYEEANAAHAALQQEALALADKAQESLTDGDGVTLFNSLSWDRTAVATLPERFANGAVDGAGRLIPVMAGQAVVTVPAMGGLSLRPAKAEAASAPVSARLTADGAVLENAAVRVTINRNGEITSLVLKASGREMVDGLMNQLAMYKDVPRLFDAWDIDSNYTELPVPLDAADSLTVEADAGFTASVRVKRSLGASTLEQVISLNAADGVVRFDTVVDWRELHRLLKVRFGGAVRSMEAMHEMQFGYVTRPTHRSRDYDKDRFEVCNHHYTALCDGSHGMAVLNDSKYGVSTEPNAIALTLLRAPSAPDMRADNKVHHFTYAITAWEGDAASAPHVRQGYELNQPLTLHRGTADFSLLAIDSLGVIAETIKLAEDGSGDVVVRLYESRNADTRFTLTLGFEAASAALCDMLEHAENDVAMNGDSIKLHIKPFEILTLRIKR